ncbi:hypothetical protein CYK22_03850 [Streptococcus salivarius]|nr:hypothetical protein CYK22_03850 [Streptococcus salivarius]
MIKKHSEKDLINNEQHIYDCFSNTTAFLGLDRVEASIKGKIKFDGTKLQIFSNNNKKHTVIKYIDSRYEYM